MRRKSIAVIHPEVIEGRILLIRGHRVMLDRDLAQLYGVETKVFLQTFKRNLERFPSDFAFQLTKAEFSNLRSQFVTSSWGGRRYLPYVFTEHGIAMLSSILNSRRAIQINIEIMRTFTKLRRLLSSNEELKCKIEALERKYDSQFTGLFFTKDIRKSSIMTFLSLGKGSIDFLFSAFGRRKVNKIIFEAIKQLLDPPVQKSQGQLGFRPS